MRLPDLHSVKDKTMKSKQADLYILKMNEFAWASISLDWFQVANQSDQYG